MPAKGSKSAHKKRVKNPTREKEIGIRVNVMRIKRGITQEELGRRLGVSFQQVQKYEKGRNRLSATRLMDIAEILGGDPLELMGWNGAARISDTSFDVGAYELSLVLRRKSPYVLATMMRLAQLLPDVKG
jgi:transcriptional regulator with XRE-family HTH domain